MNIFKYDHSCIVIEKNNTRLVIDPVEIKTKLPHLDFVKAIIVTHSHPDHFNAQVIDKIVKRNPGVVIFTTEDNMQNLPTAIVVKHGEKRNIGEFIIEFFGANHAPIDGNRIPCQNIGFVVDNMFVNPGDSFDIPPIPNPFVLAVPISGPWVKIIESMNYIRQLQPSKVLPVHDAILSDYGLPIHNNWISKACIEVNAQHYPIKPGERLP